MWGVVFGRITVPFSLLLRTLLLLLLLVHIIIVSITLVIMPKRGITRRLY